MARTASSSNSNRSSRTIRSASRTSRGRSICCMHLIKKNEVNIYDIPIALITQQYLEYLDLMQELEPRRGRRVPGDGGDADPHQVADAAAAARSRRRRIRTRIRAKRWCAGCSSTSGSRPRPSCCTSARRQRSAQWGRPDGRVADIVGEEHEPELEVDLFSLMTAFRHGARARPAAAARAAAGGADVDRDRIEQLLARLSETEACGFEELFDDVADARGHDRDVPGAAGDDPAEARPRVPAGQRSGRFASTSARGPPTRRTRSGIPSRSTRLPAPAQYTRRRTS